MQDDPDNDLNSDELQALAALRQAVEPPSQLEQRVVAELAERGLTRRGPEWWRAAAVAAALMMAAALGYAAGVGSLSPGAGTGVTDTQRSSTFALFVYDPVEGIAGVGPDAVSEAAAWANLLAEQGVLASAEKLQDEGRRLMSRDGAVQPAADFPPAGESLVLGGFFMIRAANFDEAQRIAAECPLLRYGSTIEIRAFEEL